jgi:hypothetical protein
MLGPFGSSIASTILWGSLCTPFILTKLLPDDYKLSTATHLCIVPVLASIYISLETTMPYFVIPWEIIVPVFVIMYSVLILLSLISKDFEKVLGEGKSKGGNVGYLAIAIFMVLMIGMLAYYYTGLFQYSPWFKPE